ncbi:MAG TPA: urate hydroxylase PuuD, partial [Candidatus Elarobacter sp.]
ALWTGVAIFFLGIDWTLFHVFGGRAAFLHVGAIIGTVMVANVFFVIIPGQKRMLAQIRAGQDPDPRPGRLGKMRSVHNTYLTLPVLFTMISNHYPLAYGTSWGWLVLAALAAAGVLVRRFFVISHKGRLVWALPAVAALLIALTAVAIAPRRATHVDMNAAVPAATAVEAIVAQRCAVCHSPHPTQPGISAPPAGVLLDTPEHLKANASRVYAQAVASRAMPLGNVTGMTDDERKTVGAWIDAGAQL